jgi:hypothetical protein
VRVALFLLSIVWLACSTDPDPTDAGADASVTDPDSGVIMFPCKGMSCNASETYCKLTPVGACTIVDAGACASGEEPCVTTGGSGCTPERTPSCEPFGDCDNCPCLISASPCGQGLMSINCRASGGTITVQCPYP